MATSMPDFDDMFIIEAGLFPTEIKAIPLERVGIKVFLAHITPDSAEALLKRKNRNRTIHLGQLNKIKRSLEQGRWQINGETIIFDDHGNLIEGQHRLRAVLDTGMGIWTLIVHGINFERFKTMGQGSKRTAGDILGINGEKDGRLLAAALRWVYRYENDLMSNPHPIITDDELADTILAHPKIVDSIPFGRRCHSVAAPGLCTALHYLCTKRDLGTANDFFWTLGTGEQMESTHPILVLRERFHKSDREAKRALSKMVFRDEVKAQMIASCWNMLRKDPGKRIKDVRPLVWHGQRFPRLL
jgi:hypothetical protein